RGHTIEKTIEASRLLKDAGFKLSYQMMLNLPKSSANRDFEMFEQIFENADFKPDYLKIYPLALLSEAPLHHLYKNKKFKIYNGSELIDLIKKIKKITPYWTRIERVIRDIPADKVFEGGVKTSNLRQAIHDQADGLGVICRCIRCREIKARYDPDEKFYLFREDYASAGGREIFLSFESSGRTKLASFLRLRIPSYHFNGGRHFFKVLENSAVIREIKSVGELTPVGETKRAPQHKGFGRRLLEESEIIAQKEFGIKKIAAIAAIGARQYFRKNGYKLKDSYMVKIFK
ncbi:MAG: tRNA uridine(34) 5-carboxymethylaminomethyl modification radical SAM/GNAT enzyme Elp3, partial [Patescibacteria group bacterium]